MENQKEKIFEKIITDYGRNILKVIQLPQNSRLLSQVLKEEEHNIDIDVIIRKIMRNIIRS
jgi:hypothetical protein